MNFPSTLIISSDQQISLQKINAFLSELGHTQIHNNPDIFQIDQTTGYSIAQIRQIKNFFSQKPFSHSNKIVLIQNADQLLVDSQNALLKTLEDPGPNNYLFLTAKNTSSLLPTIISRCHCLKIAQNNQTKQGQLLIPSGNLQKDLALSDTLAKDKEKVLPFLEEQMQLHHQALIQKPSPKTSLIIKNLITAIKMVNSNVDPRSALDYFLIS